MSKYYAGIGSRQTPVDILKIMTFIAIHLEPKGYVLRSGGAPGADTAFSNGAVAKEVFVPWRGYEGFPIVYPIPDAAYTISSKFHPQWNNLSPAVKTLMARNAMQVLGPQLNDPSEFVICWTPDGCENIKQRTRFTGGTGQAISIADYYNVPVYNLSKAKSVQVVSDIINKNLFTFLEHLF